MEQALQVRLQDIPPGGWHWRGRVAARLLQDPSCGVVEALPPGCSDAQWNAHLCRKGDCYHLSGEWRLLSRRRCSRCNTESEVLLHGRLVRDFRMRAGPPPEAEDTLPFPGELNLMDVLREEVWLAWPQRVLCRADCRGLCPHCGTDLNHASCACHENEDGHPFAVLKKLRWSDAGGESGD